jgi:uncharacterized membrane protein
MSTRRLTRTVAALAAVGVAIAGYLTWVHYAGIEPLCAAGDGCEKVQSSEYAELGGVPVALIGVVGYASILGSLAIPGELGRTVTALLGLIGLGFSAYLTYLEIAEIQAICQWCVASAVVMGAIAALAIVRMVTAPDRPEVPAGLEPPRRAP